MFFSRSAEAQQLLYGSLSCSIHSVWWGPSTPSSQHGRSVRAGSPVLVKAPDIEGQNIVCQGNGARVELKVINDELRFEIN